MFFANVVVFHIFSSLCPRGFNYTVSGFLKCYAVLTQTGPWDAAQKRCRQLHKDSHLAVINRASEQQIISKIIQNYSKILLRNLLHYVKFVLGPVSVSPFYCTHKHQTLFQLFYKPENDGNVHVTCSSNLIESHYMH